MTQNQMMDELVYLISDTIHLRNKLLKLLSDNMILDRKYGKLLLELEKLMREQEEHRAYNRKQKEQYKRLVVKYQIMLQKHFAICPRCKAIAAGVPLLENKYDVCPVMGS